MSTDAAGTRPMEFSEEEKAAIEAQVERVVQNPHFSHSRRFPSFLRFVVQHVLNGQADLVKERTLGIEIFGRDADYDTASDPIVRVTAAEIRKRIAQYYEEPGHEGEVRIALLPGSYIPQFQFPSATQIVAAVALPEVDRVRPSAQVVVPASKARKVWFLLAAVLAVLVVGLAVRWRSTTERPFDAFWHPILNSGDPVLFCIADQNQYAAIALRDAADPTHTTILKDNLSAVVMEDLFALVKVAGVLQAHGTKYSLKGQGDTTLTDLRNGPTVFVGAFDNAWTLRLTNPLRFHFANDPEMTKFWISDKSEPNRTPWMIDRAKQQATNNYRDYAIVARFTDNNTGKISVVAAGIGRGGTIAAGEFLSDPAHLAEALKAAGSFGIQKNMEFVLSTEIIDGHPGTPKIEASYFW